MPFRSLPFASVLPQHRQIRYVYKWGIDKDAEYWDVSTNILGSFTFAVKEMRDDLEKHHAERSRKPVPGYPCHPDVQKMSGTA